MEIERYDEGFGKRATAAGEDKDSNQGENNLEKKVMKDKTGVIFMGWFKQF